jgi:CSLREA domain-containing protein
MKHIRITFLVLIALLLYGLVLLQFVDQLENQIIKYDAVIPPTDTYTTILTTINVNTNVDELINDGNCSLREAIISANTDSPVDACPAGHGVDLISLPAGTYTLTIPGRTENAAATGDLNVTSNMYINGAGADQTVIDGNQLDRIFEFIGPAVISVSGLTIQNGNPGMAGDFQIYYGGGISIVGNTTLKLSSVNIRGNQAYKGGGIMNNGGLVHIEDSSIIDNTAVYAGGIANQGVLDLIRTSVDRNHTDLDGGGIVSTSIVTLEDCTVNGNSSGKNGGGLYISNGEATISNSSIIANSIAGIGGGAIWANSETQVSLNNSTLSQNQGGDLIYYSNLAPQVDASVPLNSLKH